MKKLLLNSKALATTFLLLSLFFVSATFGQVTKTWNKTTGGAWTTGANWTPNGVPTATDHVRIPVNQTGAITRTSSDGETISLKGLTIDGNVNFQFDPGSANVCTLNITGTLDVDTGKTLTVGITNAGRLDIALSSAATGNIDGTVYMNSYSGSGFDRTFTNNGNLTIASGGLITGQNTSEFVLSSGATLQIGSTAGITTTGSTGNITVPGTRSYSTGANYVYNGTAAQVTGNGLPATAASLKINNAAGVTLSAVINTPTVTIGDITANTVFNDGGKQITSTGTLNLTSGTFKLGAATATTFPAFATRNIAAGTTIEYGAAVAQTVSVTPAYQNITLSGAGNKTPTASGTLSVAGNFTNNSTFTHNNGTVLFNGTSAQIIGGTSATSFNNLTINTTLSTVSVTNSSAAFDVAGNLTVTDGNLVLQATDDHYNVTGNLTVAATGKLTHNVSWDVVSKQLTVAGNVAIDGIYTKGAAPRSHLQMTGTGKTIHTGTSSLNIFTVLGTVTANGALTVDDNFWAPFGSGSFTTGAFAITANSGILVSGGTLNINGGTVNITNGLTIGQATTSGVVTMGSGSLTTDGIILGDVAGTTASSLTQSGGTFTVNGAVTINQPTTPNITNTWNINNQTATVSGLITFAGASSTANKVGKIVITAGTLNANGGITFVASHASTKVIDMSGGAGNLNLKGALTVPAASSTLSPGTSSTFSYVDAGTQTINKFSSGNYYNLAISGAGVKSFAAATTITGNLSIASGASANLGAVSHSAGTLTLGGFGTATGKFGSTNTSATAPVYKNDTYFTAAATGFIIVGTSGCVAPTITFSSISNICAGALSYTLPYSATTGSPNLYSISGTGITPVSNGTLNPSTITVGLSSAAAAGTISPSAFTVASSVTGCVSANLTPSVTVIAAPNAGTNGTLTICSGSTVTASQLFARLGGSPQSGGAWTPTLAGAGTYTYTVTATSPCTVNATATVVVTAQAQPNAGTNGALTICAGSTVTGSQLFAALGGSPQPAGSWTPPLAGAGTYTYTVNATSPCTGNSTAQVVVTAQAQPNAGTNGTLTICSGSTVTASQLFARLGGSPQSGGAWTPTLAGAGTYTYTVTATSPCAVNATATVVVTAQAQPNAGTNGTLTICSGSTLTASQLFARLGGSPQSGGIWTPTLAGAGTYTYTVTATSPCTVNATATVVVTAQAQPNAGTNGTLTICSGSTVTASQLFAQLGGSPQSGGAWTPTFAGAGTYTYTVTATSPCAVNATATVVVTAQAQPNAGTNGTLTICSGSTVIASQLFARLGSSPQSGGAWTPTLAGAGTYTYTVTATSPCTVNATATVVVTTQAQPNAGADGTLTICEGSTVTFAQLNAAITGEDTGGTWSPALAGAGTYTYTVNATSPCTVPDTAIVVVTEQAGPNAGTDGVYTICAGTNITLAQLQAAITGEDAGGTWTPALAGAGTYTYTVNATSPCAIPDTSTVVVTEVSCAPAKLSNCGNTPVLTSLNARIFAANTITTATAYRYRVALSTAPSTYFYVTTAYPSFRLTDVVGLTPTYGTTYNVEIQNDFLISGNTVTSAYGSLCTVTTLPVNNITVATNQCGQTLASIASRIYVNGVSGATMYTYRIAKIPVGYPSVQPTVFEYIETPYSNFRLNTPPVTDGLVDLEYATDYEVAVSVTTASGASNFNAPCIISTPAFPTTTLQASQCGDDDDPYVVPTKSTKVYAADLISGASYTFKLEQYNEASELVDTNYATSPINYFNLNMFTGDNSLLPNTNYHVYVAINSYGQGPFDHDCVIKTSAALKQEEMTQEFKAVAYPNPFENNFMIDVKSSSQSVVNLKVYDMIGRLIDQRDVRMSDLETATIGTNYPSGVYNVIVSQDDSFETVRVIKR